MNELQKSKCGYVAIVGRPNVGKSTLLNHILGQKLCITSRKPQTTRHNVLGIKTDGSTQTIYVDTPGQHSGENRAINRYMNRVAVSAMMDVDVVLFLVEKTQWTEQEEAIARALANSDVPVILVVNKIDQLDKKSTLLPHLQTLATKVKAADIVPISALKNDNLERLEQVIEHHLPENEHVFDDEQVTDKSVRFLTAEIIREKIMRQLGDELPYQTTVEIEEFDESQETVHISAVILVERDGQKTILIGQGGSRIKLIGQESRAEIEALIERQVMLKLWVKVKSGWSDDERALRSLGYND